MTQNHMMMNSDLAKGAAVMTVGYVAGTGIMRRLLTHPLVMFGAGVAVGYLGFRYRKEIVAAAVRGSEMGKDAMLNARESLADLVEETKDPGEAKG